MRLDILNALDKDAIIKELNVSSNKIEIANSLSKLGIPNKKTEKYRYFDIVSLMQKDWNILEHKDSTINKSGNSVIIEDGNLITIPDIDGISVESEEFLDVDNSHFDALYYLSHLLSQKAIVIRCSKDVKFEIKHKFANSDVLNNYRIVLLVDANCHIQVVESFEGEAKNSFILSGYDVFLSRDASAKFIKSQTLCENSYTPIFSSRYKIDENANFKLSTYDFVQDNGLNIFKAYLHKNANIEANHLLYANKSAKFGTISEIEHIGTSSNSNQKAKNILDEKSRSIFDALIRVAHSGKWTKAHQNSKAILLNSGAYMASKPQLEIYIDDLEASHGSTTGQLDEQQLFYLRSRGIKEQEARKMLILAFANELIDSIEDEEVANKIHTEFEKAYYGNSQLECISSCHGCEEAILKD